MDCCNYEYRAGGGYAPPPWEGYAPCAPLPYAPYAHYYAPHAHAHDPYARYYRYDYPAHHAHHTDHALPMGWYFITSLFILTVIGHVCRVCNSVSINTHLMKKSDKCESNSLPQGYVQKSTLVNIFKPHNS